MTVNYISLVQPKFLSKEFLLPYVEKKAPFGSNFGLVVYLRTYSRFIPELQRRERWWETVVRVVEYSMSLYQGPAKFDDLKKEAEELFDYIFNMKVFPAGRTLWVGGSGVVTKNSESNFNCSFRVIDSIEAFVEIFHLLLVGAGTGFSVEQKYIEQLPQLNTDIKISHRSYNERVKSQRQENTTIELKETSAFIFDPIAQESKVVVLDNSYLVDSKSTLVEDSINVSKNCSTVVIHVGDSKLGWTSALKAFLHALTIQERKFEIQFVYDSIRPAGERLMTMGGRASGPAPLRTMFEKIEHSIQLCKGILNSVAAMDICNYIAEGVVVGGVRRSSQIALGNLDDQDFVDAKYNLWSDETKAFYRSSRVMSNNSVHLYKNPGIEKLREIFKRIANNGEPGIYVAETAIKRRPNYSGTNPCAEILLANQGVCNLTELNVHAFVKEVNGKNIFDYEDFQKAVELATRMGSRITNVNMWHPEWDAVQKRDRLLGVSLTGQVEAWDALGWGYSFDENGNYLYESDYRIAQVLSEAKYAARSEADRYHSEMRIPSALLVTTGKPSGTIAQLPTVSSGIHRPYAPYYLRRIRISRFDPVAKSLRNLGVPVVPENSQGDDLEGEQCNTWVFTFPMKTSAPIRAIDEKAIDQLERYRQIMQNYIEHNQSITVTVAPEEWDEVAEWLAKPENWNLTIGVSFLPRWDPVAGGTASYPNLPYQPSTQEEYEELSQQISFNEEELINLISEFEKTDYEETELDADCSGNFCPVR